MDPDAETKEDKRKMPKVTKVYYRSYIKNSSNYKVWQTYNIFEEPLYKQIWQNKINVMVYGIW